ncbi:MAG: Ig-like domain-containing protein [Caulobacteraceae bacterium]
MIYDALGRVIAVTTPDGKQTVYTYDPAGNRITVQVNATAAPPPSAPDESVSYSYGQPPPVITPTLGPTVSIVGVTSAQFGATSFTGSSLTYTPSATEIAGADHIGYEVKDSSTALTSSALVTVNLAPAAPIASADAITLAENGQLQFTPTFSDPNHLPVSITAVSTPAHGTAVINSGTSITYTPTTGFWCAQWPQPCDSFTYTVTNSANLTATATVSAVVTAEPPTANPISIETAVNQPLNFDPRGSNSDPQGLPLALSALGAPSHGTAVITGAGAALYTPASGYSGPDSNSYSVVNSGGGAATGTVSATVGAALSVSVDVTSWNWLRVGQGPVHQSAAVNGAASGGQGPYSFSWQYISGQTGMSATSPNWLSTQWSWRPPEDGNQYTSIWELKVTDSASHVAYGPQVSVKFEWINPQ